jgi:hypothetical protein
MTDLLSRQFVGRGTYNGQNQVPGVAGMPPMLWSGGQPAAPMNGIGVEPWENVSIDIHEIEILFSQGAQYLGAAFAGNGWSPDVMRSVLPGGMMLPNPIKRGFSFPFPSVAACIPGVSNKAFMDIHVIDYLDNGQPFTFFYTVYYTRRAE